MIPKGIKEEDFVYTNLPSSQIKETYHEFMNLLKDFATTINMNDAHLEANLAIFTRICVRVDQRKDYFMYYHSVPGKVMHMSHEKEIGLWSYWVSKYKPVKFKNITDNQLFFQQNGCDVSDAFAAYIVISIVCHNKKSRAKYFTSEKVANLYYDFANRDFSKEAIMARIEDLIT